MSALDDYGTRAGVCPPVGDALYSPYRHTVAIDRITVAMLRLHSHSPDTKTHGVDAGSIDKRGNWWHEHKAAPDHGRAPAETAEIDQARETISRLTAENAALRWRLIMAGSESGHIRARSLPVRRVRRGSLRYRHSLGLRTPDHGGDGRPKDDGSTDDWIDIFEGTLPADRSD